MRKSYSLPIVVKVAIVQGPQVVHAPIKRIVELYMDGIEHYGELRDCVYCPRYPNGIFVGCYASGMPVLTEGDLRPMPKRTSRQRRLAYWERA